MTRAKRIKAIKDQLNQRPEVPWEKWWVLDLRWLLNELDKADRRILELERTGT